MLVNCISTHNQKLSLIFIFYFLLMFTKALLDIHCNTLIDSMVVLLQEYQHYLTINLTTLRIWCYRCESEVFPSRNTPTFMYVYFTITHTTMLFIRDKKLNVCSSSEP